MINLGITSEMNKLFIKKQEITSKLDHNLAQQKALKQKAKCEKNQYVRLELKAEYKKRQKIVRAQIEERCALTGKRIGARLGFSECYVNISYRSFLSATDCK